MMKKRTCYWLVAALGLSLAACTSSNNEGDHSDQRMNETPATPPPVNTQLTDTMSSMQNSPNRSNSPRDTARKADSTHHNQH